jgi:hypothetical protein
MDRIIKASSVPKQCSYIPRYIPLPLALKTIIFSYLHLNLVDTVKIKFEKFDFFNNRFNKNLSHSELVTAGVDIIGQLHNLSYITENGEQWLISIKSNSVISNASEFASTF